jgi:hypothetical protein
MLADSDNMKKSGRADEPVGYLLGTGTWRDWFPAIPRPVFALGAKDLYSVLIEGSGFSLSISGTDAPVIGFFTTRFVAATDGRQAEKTAFESVLHEWRCKGFLKLSGTIPKLHVEKIQLLSDRFLFRSGGGFTFFPDSNAE